MLSSTPATVAPNGMVVATQAPKNPVTAVTPVEGGLLNAAVKTTTNKMVAQANQAKAAGATMRGGSVVNVPQVAGDSQKFAANHAKLTEIAGQIKASGTYDSLLGGQPYQVGGRRHERLIRQHRRHSRPAQTAGRKHRRKTKKHASRRSRRTRRRDRRKSRNSTSRV